ncbi:unnamed protein product [Ectocarpus sp. 8 AP-2014]
MHTALWWSARCWYSLRRQQRHHHARAGCLAAFLLFLRNKACADTATLPSCSLLTSEIR